MIHALLLGLLLTVTPLFAAEAPPLELHGFDDVSDDATTNNIDVLGLMQHRRGGAADADIRVVQQGGGMHTHNSLNGGTDASLWSGYVDLASGETAYWSTMGACTCSTSGNCGTGGVCEAGFCIDGDLQHTSCTADGDCASAQACTTSPVLSSLQIAAALSVHIGANAPGVEHSFAEWWMDASGSDGRPDARGPFWTISPDKKIRVYFGDYTNARCVASGSPAACCTGSGTGTCTGSQLGSASGETLEVTNCAALDANDKTAVLLPCSADSDCSPRTCNCSGGGCSGSGCNATTGAGCFWGGLEMPTTLSGSTAIGEFFFNGRLSITESPVTVGAVSLIVDFRFGGPGGEVGSGNNLQLWFDDAVLQSGLRAHHGYVGRQVPSTDGKVLTLTPNGSGSCTSGGGIHNDCIDDYATSTFQYDGNDVRRQKKNTTDEFFRMEPTVGVNGLAISAVEPVLVGETDSTTSGTRKLFEQVLICASIDGSGNCVSKASTAKTEFTVGTSTTTRVLGRTVVSTSPEAGATTWTDSGLNKMGVAFGLTDNFTGAGTHMGAQLTYFRVVRPDVPLQVLIRDGNKGPEDGVITICTGFDSLDGSVNAQQCSNSNQFCSQETYCPGINDTNKSFPTGGCLLNGTPNDAICQTCTGKYRGVGGANNGAGYPCAEFSLDTGCGDAQTCDSGTGFCTVNTNIPCGTGVSADNTKCQGLGVCARTNTCTYSCPSGVCPTRAAWGFAVYGRTGFDVLLRCPQDGDTADLLVNGASSATNPQRHGRFFQLLDGLDSHCSADVGTGQCTCTVGDPDCGTSGTCTNGKCQSGSGSPSRYACTDSTTCASGKVCAFPPCDLILVVVGGNTTFSQNAPNCLGLATQTMCSQCNTPTPTSCVADSTCNSGGGKVSDFSICWTGANEETTACNASGDCPNSGQYCVGGGSSGTTRTGYCSCGIDSNLCPTNFACVNGMCRRKCPNGNGDCAGGVTCNLGTSPNVCNSLCSCPCDSKTCTTDKDCDFGDTCGTIFDADTCNFRRTGICSGGKCACCGIDTCGDTAQCMLQYRAYLRSIKDYELELGALEKAQRIIDELPETDRRPTFMINTYPKWPRQPFCDEGTGHPHLQRFAQIASKRLLRDTKRFRNVIDIRRLPIFSAHPVDQCYADEVHLTNICSDALGADDAVNINSWNVCADITRGAEHQLTYCKKKDGTFVSPSPCATSGDCAVGETCSPRPCACQCRTAVDCAKFRDATCQDAGNNVCDVNDTLCTCKRTTSHADSCLDLYGGSYACAADGQCKDGSVDACPLSGDVCRIQ